MDKETQKKILTWILEQVKRAERHKKQLIDRLARLNAENVNPFGIDGYEPLPHTVDKVRGTSIMVKLSDIETRIIEQQREIERCIVNVSDIVEFIPIHTVDREIFELRYIDGMSWESISDVVFMSKQSCHKHKDLTLDNLLKMPKIQAMVKDAWGDYKKWQDEAEGLLMDEWKNVKKNRKKSTNKKNIEK